MVSFLVSLFTATLLHSSSLIHVTQKGQEGTQPSQKNESIVNIWDVKHAVGFHLGLDCIHVKVVIITWVGRQAGRQAGREI